jgi:hypothetical protein
LPDVQVVAERLAELHRPEMTGGARS